MVKDFKIEPGRVWLIPVDENGLQGEPVEISQPLPSDTFDWDIDPGYDRGSGEGLDGGLQGWPDGARMEAYGGSTWNIQLEFDQEIPEETMALLLGLSVEQYRDLKQWVGERARLEMMTGQVWSLE